METWDLYDENFNKVGKTISNNERVPDNYYHISLEIWIINKKNEVLLIRNSLDYSRRYPGSWSCIGGNLCHGETIETAIARIIKQKIGSSCSIEHKKIYAPVKRDPYRYAYITCILFDEVDTKNISFDDYSVTETKFIDKQEIVKMCNNGEISYYLIERINNEIMPYIN